jgi:hypothetical protein
MDYSMRELLSALADYIRKKRLTSLVSIELFADGTGSVTDSDAKVLFQFADPTELIEGLTVGRIDWDDGR